MYFVCTWQEYTKFTNDCQDCTRQVNTCIFMSSYLPVWAISRENIKSKSSLSRNAVLSSFYTANIFCYFRLVCWRRRQKKKNPSSETETPSLSVLRVPVWIYRWWHCCQSGSTPTPTLRARAIGARAPFSVSWLANTAVNHAPARESGSPVAPSVCHTILTLDINILTLLSRKQVAADMFEDICLNKKRLERQQRYISIKSFTFKCFKLSRKCPLYIWMAFVSLACHQVADTGFF